jgi:hypothetical protein
VSGSRVETRQRRGARAGAVAGRALRVLFVSAFGFIM